MNRMIDGTTSTAPVTKTAIHTSAGTEVLGKNPKRRGSKTKWKSVDQPTGVDGMDPRTEDLGSATEDLGSATEDLGSASDADQRDQRLSSSGCGNGGDRGEAEICSSVVECMSEAKRG